MSDKERLIVQLEARINDFEKRMKKAERTGTRSYTRLRRGSRSATRAMEMDMLRSTASINKALAATSTRIGGFGKAMVTGLAAGVVTAALAGVTGGLNSVVKGIAAVGDEAKRSGLSNKVFQEWKFIAEQNRIGVDQMVDGFKELNLRADEFAVTGKGPAAEAFQRIGFTARELKRKLKDPSALMLEIIGRMEELDKAAQIRVADEVFGGSAGERFVELLSQGEDGLRKTINRAHELGAVMDDDVIARADELDRKFGELAEKASRIGKGLAVGIAEVVAEIADTTAKLEDYLDSAARAKGLLGGDIADALEKDAAAIEENAKTLQGLDAVYDDLSASARMAAPYLERAGLLLQAYGETEAARALFDAASGMRELVAQIEDGSISAEDFEIKLNELALKADETFSALDEIDQVEFSGAISAVHGLASALSAAIKRAATLREALPIDPGPPVTYGPPRRGGFRAGSAPTRSLRPKAAPPLREVDTERGGGSRGDDFQRQVAAIREKTAALESEAASLVAAAAGGKRYGNALEYARRRAELTNAALKAGKDITPALQAEIDALAAAYVNAGDAAEQAADKLVDMEDSAERGADALSDIFLGVIDGSRSAKEAVSDLLREIASIQLRRGFANLALGGGPLSWLGGLLSFDGGGFTGAGPRTGGVDGRGGFPAILHPNETVIDHNKSQGMRVGDTYHFAPVIQMTGSGDDVARLEAAMQRASSEFESRVVNTVVAARKRRIL